MRDGAEASSPASRSAARRCLSPRRSFMSRSIRHWQRHSPQNRPRRLVIAGVLTEAGCIQSEGFGLHPVGLGNDHNAAARRPVPGLHRPALSDGGAQRRRPSFRMRLLCSTPLPVRPRSVVGRGCQPSASATPASGSARRGRHRRRPPRCPLPPIQKRPRVARALKQIRWSASGGAGRGLVTPWRAQARSPPQANTTPGRPAPAMRPVRGMPGKVTRVRSRFATLSLSPALVKQ